MRPIIEVNSVCKKYRLGGASGGRFQTLRDALAAKFSKGAKGAAGARPNEFWALSDVSFGVSQGEVIGIIGKNGAGKSTLLKIMSRITEPTRGELVLRGRVASLLEVGTGFHPELSGRENIYLNGIILGMKRSEVRQRFDEIVAFSEVERFLDTPVKRYSSGMYVRLAFAVAAHLDPDILIVDEVLAVGDLAFQQKCLKKMGDLSSRGGRTILFVSHSLDAIRKLTARCVVLERGRVVCDAPTSEAVSSYIESMVQSDPAEDSLRDKERPHWAGDGKLAIVGGNINRSGNGLIEVRVRIDPLVSVSALLAEIKIHDWDGTVVGTAFPVASQPVSEGANFDLVADISDPGFAPGKYFCTIVILDPSRRVRDAVTNVLPFSVEVPESLPHQHHAWDRQWGALQLETARVQLSPRPAE